MKSPRKLAGPALQRRTTLDKRHRYTPLIFAAIACISTAQTPDHIHSKKALASVNGKLLYEDDLSPTAEGELRQLTFRQYEERMRANEHLIIQKLLDTEAIKRGISRETLLSQDVDANVPEPNASEVQAYYFGLKDRISRPFDDIKSDLLLMLKQARIQEAREAYVKKIFARNTVTFVERPPRVQVATDMARLRGDPNALVTIVEFSDFECPFCQKSELALKTLLLQYKGKVNLSYRDFPLNDVHPRAQLAAEASRCAGEQGRFWEFHDLLFENPNRLGLQGLIEKAHQLKLDVQRFNFCVSSGQYKPQVEQDIQDARRAGLSATPGFFINGVFLSGAQPMSAFKEIIDDELSPLPQP
jgi:protein-disulfide isomerase